MLISERIFVSASLAHRRVPTSVTEWFDMAAIRPTGITRVYPFETVDESLCGTPEEVLLSVIYICFGIKQSHYRPRQALSVPGS